jgi:hypothetical protein
METINLFLLFRTIMLHEPFSRGSAHLTNVREQEEEPFKYIFKLCSGEEIEFFFFFPFLLPYSISSPKHNFKII